MSDVEASVLPSATTTTPLLLLPSPPPPSHDHISFSRAELSLSLSRSERPPENGNGVVQWIFKGENSEASYEFLFSFFKGGNRGALGKINTS